MGSAGHVSAWIVEREAECHAMSSTGPLLGAGIELGWQTERIQFRAGSRMTLLTDGVLERSEGEGPTVVTVETLALPAVAAWLP